MQTWTEAQNHISALIEDTSFLTRVANWTNQRPAAVELARQLDLSRNFSVRVTVIGKTENGARPLADQLTAAFGPRLRTYVIETPDYDSIPRNAWNDARESAAIVFVIPSIAALYDETQDTLAREFAGEVGKLFLVIVSHDDLTTEDAAVPDLRQVLAPAAVVAGRDLSAVLEAFLIVNQVKPLVDSMRTQIAASIRRLQPVVTAFAGFLAMDQADFASRLEYTRRDLEALQNLSQQAQKTFEMRSQAAMSGGVSQLVSLSANMIQLAERTVQSAFIPHDVLSSQEARTRFGRELSSMARAAGYRDFDGRAEAISRNLTGARALLLSDMDQVRAEAEAHLEELQLNLGPELFATLLKPPLDVPGVGLLDIPLDPGDKFAGIVTETMQEVRREISDATFASAWASRIEGMFRVEMRGNATSGWSAQTIDGPAAAELTRLWQETVAREAGLLIGRVHALSDMIQTGLTALRLSALQLPKDKDARATIGGAFGACAARLQQIGERPSQP